MGFFTHEEETRTIKIKNDMEEWGKFFGGEIIDFKFDGVNIIYFHVIHKDSLSVLIISTKMLM